MPFDYKGEITRILGIEFCKAAFLVYLKI